MVKLAILSFKFSLLSFLVEYKFDTFENSVGNLLIKLRRTDKKIVHNMTRRKKRPEDNKLQRESKAEVKSSNTYYSEEEIEKHSH